VPTAITEARRRRSEVIASAGTALAEVGRVLSAKNEKALKLALETLQSILTQIGATEDAPAESAVAAVEAALAQDDSFDAIRYAVQAALRKRAMADMLAQAAADDGADMEDMYDCPAPWIRDIYPGVVVYQLDGDLYQCDYTINPDESVTLGPPIEVEVAYVPAPDADDAALPTGSVTVPTEAAAPTRTEGGRKFKKSDYAYTPSDHPSSWKLRLTATPGGDPDPRMVGAAAAAFSSGGYRGQKVELPADAVAGAKAKVRAAWKKAHPDKTASEMPDSIKESEAAPAAESAEVEVTSDLIDLVEKAVRRTAPSRSRSSSPAGAAAATTAPRCWSATARRSSPGACTCTWTTRPSRRMPSGRSGRSGTWRPSWTRTRAGRPMARPAPGSTPTPGR
jgi:hypothetical protein